jgi:hypothetical protein
MRRPWSALGRSAIGEKIVILILLINENFFICPLLLLLLVVVVVVIRARSQGSVCTAAVRLIVHPFFYKFPLSPPDVSTSYATREI